MEYCADWRSRIEDGDPNLKPASPPEYEESGTCFLLPFPWSLLRYWCFDPALSTKRKRNTQLSAGVDYHRTSALDSSIEQPRTRSLLPWLKAVIVVRGGLEMAELNFSNFFSPQASECSGLKLTQFSKSMSTFFQSVFCTVFFGTQCGTLTQFGHHHQSFDICMPECLYARM